MRGTTSLFSALELPTPRHVQSRQQQHRPRSAPASPKDSSSGVGCARHRRILAHWTLAPGYHWNKLQRSSSHPATYEQSYHPKLQELLRCPELHQTVSHHTAATHVATPGARFLAPGGWGDAAGPAPTAAASTTSPFRHSNSLTFSYNGRTFGRSPSWQSIELVGCYTWWKLIWGCTDTETTQVWIFYWQLLHEHVTVWCCHYVQVVSDVIKHKAFMNHYRSSNIVLKQCGSIAEHASNGFQQVGFGLTPSKTRETPQGSQAELQTSQTYPVGPDMGTVHTTLWWQWEREWTALARKLSTEPFHQFPKKWPQTEQ